MPKNKNKHDKKKKGKDGKGWRGSFLKHPGFLSKPVTARQFRKELRSMRKLEFGPEARQLHAEQRASKLQQERIGDWFPQYLKQVGRLNRRTDDYYDQAIQGSQQDAAQASQYAENLRQKIAAQNQASAEQRGATYNPGIDLQAAQANAARNTTNAGFTSLLRTQGATQHAYLADKRRIGKGEMISQLLAEQSRGRQVNQDLRDLASRKRDFAKEFINQLRPQERDFYLGLLEAKLGNKQAKLAAETSRQNSKRTAKTARAERRQENRQFRKEQQQENRHHRQDRRDDRRDNGGKDMSNRRERQQDIQHMLALLRTTPAKKLRKASKQEIIDLLISKSQTYSRGEAKRAYKKFKKGHKGGGHRRPGGPQMSHK